MKWALFLIFKLRVKSPKAGREKFRVSPVQRKGVSVWYECSFATATDFEQVRVTRIVRKATDTPRSRLFSSQVTLVPAKPT